MLAATGWCSRRGSGPGCGVGSTAAGLRDALCARFRAWSGRDGQRHRREAARPRGGQLGPDLGLLRARSRRKLPTTPAETPPRRAVRPSPGLGWPGWHQTPSRPRTAARRPARPRFEPPSRSVSVRAPDRGHGPANDDVSDNSPPARRPPRTVSRTCFRTVRGEFSAPDFSVPDHRSDMTKPRQQPGGARGGKGRSS